MPRGVVASLASGAWRYKPRFIGAFTDDRVNAVLCGHFFDRDRVESNEPMEAFVFKPLERHASLPTQMPDQIATLAKRSAAFEPGLLAPCGPGESLRRD